MWVLLEDLAPFFITELSKLGLCDFRKRHFSNYYQFKPNVASLFVNQDQLLQKENRLDRLYLPKASHNLTRF